MTEAEYLDRRKATLEYAIAFRGVKHASPWWIESAAEIRKRIETGKPWTHEDELAQLNR